MGGVALARELSARRQGSPLDLGFHARGWAASVSLEREVFVRG